MTDQNTQPRRCALPGFDTPSPNRFDFQMKAETIAALTELAWHIDPDCKFTGKLRDPLLAELTTMTQHLAHALDALYEDGSDLR